MSDNVINQQFKAVVRALQGDFPLCERPFALLAQQAHMSEEDFINCVKSLAEKKTIRKMGAVLRHRQAGFNANALCAWAVPPDRLDEVASIMIRNPAVSHCYDRSTAPNWNYNLYTMIHARSRTECDSIISDLSLSSGILDFQVLYSKKEWKKTSMQYFCD